MGAAKSVWAGWGLEEPWVRVSVWRARGLWGPRQSQIHGFVGFRAGHLSLEIISWQQATRTKVSSYPGR